MLTRLLMIPLFAALAVASSPAHAGRASRASACKAPPFSVPRETQRAVDAAIDARVTGTGAGAVSSSVETRTDYDTTTLTQDAAARAWTEYSLCAKLAKKLISQELHDELLRALVAPQTLAAVQPAPTAAVELTPSPTPAPLSDADAIVGTWQVTSRFDWMSCPDGSEGGTSAYLWLVSVTPDGEVVVTIQGKTAFDQMRGTFSEGRLRAGGVRQKDGEAVPVVLGTTAEGRPLVALHRSDVDVRLEGDELIGFRDVVWGVTEVSEDGASELYLPCIVRYEVQARR